MLESNIFGHHEQSGRVYSYDGPGAKIIWRFLLITNLGYGSFSSLSLSLLFVCISCNI
jgi:hypothetical protein